MWLQAAESGMGEAVGLQLDDEQIEQLDE